MPDFIKLADIIRGDKLESQHFGVAVLVDKNGTKQALGNDQIQSFTRSIIKPIQAKVAMKFLGQELALDLLAIACASHTSEPEQLALINKFLQVFNLDQADLFCGSIEHNCAGKHSLMLAATHSAQDYHQATHNLQQAIVKELQRLNPQLTSIPIASDGCGLPTYYMSLEDMGICFANLITDQSYARIITAMNNYPYIIAGKNKFDSELMAAYPNKFIAKGGAEGLMMIANLETKEVLIVKIADGSQRAKFIIARELLRSLNWIDDIECDSNIYNAQAAKAGVIVGVAKFPVLR